MYARQITRPSSYFPFCAFREFVQLTQKKYVRLTMQGYVLDAGFALYEEPGEVPISPIARFFNVPRSRFAVGVILPERLVGQFMPIAGIQYNGAVRVRTRAADWNSVWGGRLRAKGKLYDRGVLPTFNPWKLM